MLKYSASAAAAVSLSGCNTSSSEVCRYINENTDIEVDLSGVQAVIKSVKCGGTQLTADQLQDVKQNTAGVISANPPEDPLALSSDTATPPPPAARRLSTSTDASGSSNDTNTGTTTGSTQKLNCDTIKQQLKAASDVCLSFPKDKCTPILAVGSFKVSDIQTATAGINNNGVRVLSAKCAFGSDAPVAVSQDFLKLWGRDINFWVSKTTCADFSKVLEDLGKTTYVQENDPCFKYPSLVCPMTKLGSPPSNGNANNNRQQSNSRMSASSVVVGAYFGKPNTGANFKILDSKGCLNNSEFAAGEQKKQLGLYISRIEPPATCQAASASISKLTDVCETVYCGSTFNSAPKTQGGTDYAVLDVKITKAKKIVVIKGNCTAISGSTQAQLTAINALSAITTPVVNSCSAIASVISSIASTSFCS